MYQHIWNFRIFVEKKVMKKVTINISGINRAIDDGISADGQCAELINLRNVNGSLQPVGRPQRDALFAREPVYIHKAAGYEHYISVSGGTVYYDYDKVGDTYNNVGYVIGSFDGDFVSCESVGNMLVVLSSVDIYYYLWSGNAYGYLGNSPDLPIFTLKSGLVLTQQHVYAQSESTFTEDQLNSTPRDPIRDTIKATIDGLMAKAVSKCKDEGRVGNVVFLRYALRLLDGSLILHSPVYTIKPKSMTLTASSTDPATLTVKAYYEDAVMECISSKSVSAWSSIVSSVDFFMAEAPFFRDECTTDVASAMKEQMNELTISPRSVNSAFAEIDGFYYIGSMSIADVKAGATFELRNVSKGVRQNLVQQEPMEHDNLSQHSSVGGCSYVYNGRLIIGDITTKLKNPHNGAFYTYNISQTTTSTFAQSAQVINTENGLATVVAVDGSSYAIGKWQPVLVATDYRATSLQLRTSGSNQIFSLKKHPLLNISYYQDPDLEPISLEATSSSTPVESNTIQRDGRKIKVSGLNNPVVFPTALTYTVSNGDVMAFQSITSALSTGQFGQYPLYIFATDGVYALEVGTGDVVYSRATPVSRDCCANRHAIVSTDNSVVFATEGSIVMLTGSDSQVISAPIEGYLPSFVDSSPVIGKVADIVKYSSLISITEFRNYIDNCIIGYCYEDKEIIVSNKDYNYSYVYNLTSRQWHKTSVKAQRYLNSYPTCQYVYNGSTGYGIYNMYNPVRTVNNVLLVTKPIKFGSLTHKRILQSAIRGTVRPSKSDVYLRGENVHYRDTEVDIFSNTGFYILGSNDAEHFAIIGGREKISDVRDLITKMNKSKAFKYFMILLAGGVRTDVSLNYFEFMVDETYTNRIR